MTRQYVLDGSQLASWRQEAMGEAHEVGINPAAIDSLLQAFTSLDASSLSPASSTNQIEIQLDFDFAELKRRWRKRLNDRMPLPYMTGVASWRNFSLTVSPDVLIPRPQTACLIDLAIAFVNSQHSLKSLQSGHWADLGTGSGAIALGLANAFPQATIHAVDCSAKALAIAEQNAVRHCLKDHIQLYQGSWFEPLEKLQGQLSAMVANPPYMPSHTAPDLPPEMRLHEPKLAYDGGADGLDFVRELVAIAPDYLRSGGLWLVETLAGQAPAVKAMLEKQGSYHNIQMFPNLANVADGVLAQIK